ncbi:MAG: type IV pilus secretin PilQ [Candidatus Koribacter versatilis]|uniref:Type IV pilus secretin PilQ n=1 Tax=Candidatus Korobacter versatilis TaxID=658062 RepID=A0A932EPU8_9BACT|nr:type IV pilus secretin PilQ [Candidatus Koribacter versatilis]
MRLKQLLGILLLCVVCATTAAAAGSTMTDVSVATQGATTTVTIRANGAFTHTEYRPSDSLLLVDLAGVSAAKLDGRLQKVQTAGVTSYRVMGYRGVGGADVARLEITLAPGAAVSFSEGTDQLVVRVDAGDHSYGPAEAANHAAIETVKSQAQAEPSATVTKTAVNHTSETKTAKPVTIRTVGVTRHNGALAVEIVASGAIQPKAMKLTKPDRVVIDLPNAIPAGKGRDLAVDSGDIKGVRYARFQMDPPVTRVVVDLKSAQDFQLTPAGNKLMLTFAPAAAAKPAAAPTSAPVAETVAKTEAKAAETVAAETPVKAAAPAADKAPAFVALNLDGSSDETRPAARASQAAAKFTPVSDENPSGAPTTASLKVGPAVNMSAMQAANPPQMPSTGPQNCSRTRYTGEPVSVNLKDVDLKDFFRLIHEISGLNIVLDPNVKGSVTLVLDEVPWDQALNIVLKNNGLECELDGNVLRIATLDTLKKEADAQRAQREAKALAVPKVTQTIFLSYAHSADLVTTIKKFLSPRGEVIADPRLNALIIEDIPSYLPPVNALIKQLDFKTQEVEVSARVVAATRNFAREFGMQIGFGFGNSVSAVGGAGAVGNSPIQNAVPTAPQYIQSGTNSIPLFSNLPVSSPTSPASSGLSFTNATNLYRIDAILTMAESRGLIKILSRPNVATQDNIPALIEQGVKVPVVTQAQLGGPSTTQYVDALLRLRVTPQITRENTIFLNIEVENTTPDFSRSVNGSPPSLLTQHVKTEVLVTDGGTIMLGGVIRTTNSLSVKQVPVLGSIPILGYLFKNRAVSSETQELLFFITPKIIQT